MYNEHEHWGMMLDAVITRHMHDRYYLIELLDALEGKKQCIDMLLENTGLHQAILNDPRTKPGDVNARAAH